MERLFHLLIAAAQARPGLALTAVALVAFTESLAIVGTVVPSAVVMFAAGALVGQGVLGLPLTLAAAVAGAVAGDALSFELGRSREPQVRSWTLFRRHEAAVRRAEGFVRQHGATSVVLARFTGAVRAFVPLLAGFAHMGRLRFYLTNVASAALWAPAHILPGVLFGGSLGLAEEVSGRLAMMILLLVLLVAVTVWLVGRVRRALLPRLRRLRLQVVTWAAGRRGALPALAASLLDPQRPGSHALLLGAVVLLGAGWLFVGVMQDVIARDPLVQADLWVRDFLLRLRTAPVDRVMALVSDLGSAVVLLAVALVTALWLLLRGCRRTLVAWVGAVGVAALLAGLLALSLGRELQAASAQLAWSSGNVTLGTSVLGFLAFLIARRAPPRSQALVAAVAASTVVLVAVSTLVLGTQRLSQVLAGISLGLAWVSFCALVVTARQVDEPLQPGRLALLVVATAVVATLAWHGGQGSAGERLALARPAPTPWSAPDWAQTGWQTIPLRRRELDGDREERFGVQAACTRTQLDRALRDAGWRPAAPWTLASVLRALAGNPDPGAAPVLPRFDRGQPSTLAFVHPQGADRREVLRLWRSAAVLADGAAVQPIWYGGVYDERRLASGWLEGWLRLEAVEARPRALAQALGLPPGWVLGQPDREVLLLRCR
jgi:membrane protein DedA with SNARE-associated domain